ncbi:pali-domain-containing protein [Hypoxylon fuscum]|nr:pali-domain-containing protein [Hypoxylon fuscum]
MAALQAGSKALASRVAHAFALVLIAAAFALLLAVDATAPVNHGLALFTVRNDHVQINEGRPVVHLATAGTFGYCMQIVASFSSTASSSSSSSSRTPTPDRCSPASIGYDPADAVSAVSILRSASAREPHLTRVMILHPLATASTFFALATALFPSRLVPAPVPPALSMLSTVLLLAALVCDFVLFGGLRRRLEIASLRPSLRPRCSGTPPPWGPSTRGSGPCWRRRCACSSGLWCWSCGNRDNVELEDYEEGKTDRSSGTAVPPYELGHKPERVELSPGAKVESYELSGQGGRVELAGEERHELDTSGLDLEPKSRLGKV